MHVSYQYASRCGACSFTSACSWVTCSIHMKSARSRTFQIAKGGRMCVWYLQNGPTCNLERARTKWERPVDQSYVNYHRKLNYDLIYIYIREGLQIACVVLTLQRLQLYRHLVGKLWNRLEQCKNQCLAMTILTITSQGSQSVC